MTSLFFSFYKVKSEHRALFIFLGMGSSGVFAFIASFTTSINNIYLAIFCA